VSVAITRRSFGTVSYAKENYENFVEINFVLDENGSQNKYEDLEE